MKRFIEFMLFLVLTSGCMPAESARAGVANPAAMTPTYPCPIATPEYLAVEPLPLRTDQDFVTISVTISNGEQVTITSEYASVTAAERFDSIRLPLKAGKLQHFTVEAQVRQMGGAGGCTYGGYTLTTTSDRNGLPLIVTQGADLPLSLPQKRIAPETLGALQLVNALPRTGSVSALFFLNDQELLTVGDQIAIWNALDGSQTLLIDGGGQPLLLRAADLDAQRGKLAAGGSPADVRLWDLKGGEPAYLPPLAENGAQALTVLAFSPDGVWLAGGGQDGRLYFWNARQLTALAVAPMVAEGYQPVSGLHWLDETRLLAVYLNQLVIWEIPVPREVQRISAPEEFLNYAGSSLSLDRTTLWLTAGNEKLYAYRFADESWQIYPPGDENVFTAGYTLALSPDEQFALAADSFGGVRFWLLDAPRRLSAPVLPMNNISAATFSPEGRLLAITSPSAATVWILGIP